LPGRVDKFSFCNSNEFMPSEKFAIFPSQDVTNYLTDLMERLPAMDEWLWMLLTLPVIHNLSGPADG
jgi:hypothetical protein